MDKLTLKAARVNSGYSQKEVAKLLGLSIDTIGNYERGKSYPRPHIISMIENLYNITYDEINFYPKNTVKRRIVR